MELFGLATYLGAYSLEAFNLEPIIWGLQSGGLQYGGREVREFAVSPFGCLQFEAPRSSAPTL
jgi:hypothetical protein